MSIKSGDLIHIGDQLLIDRAQTIGVSNLNQTETRVYEVGNYETVGIVRDIPDLTWSVESVDASAALEALLCGGVPDGSQAAFAGKTANPAADADGTWYDIGSANVLDVVGQFKPGRTFPAAAGTHPNKFDIMASIATPQLNLSQLSYRFGMRANAAQTATLNGDSMFWAEGSGFVESCTGAVAKAGYALTHPAIPYNGDFNAGTRFALNVRVIGGRRLRFGVDYTEAAAAAGPNGDSVVTITVTATDISDTAQLSITYQSATAQQNYPQSVHTLDGLVKPAAVRGKDITVLLAPQGAQLFGSHVDPAAIDRGLPADPSYYMTGVQDVGADWRVTLQNDEEFGNSQYVSTDFDVPTTNGTITFKPVSPHDMMRMVRQIAGLAAGAVEVVGPYQVVNLQLAYLLHSPYDGHVLKTIYCPDARFTLPSGQARVQQKLTWSFAWESVGGDLYVSKGVGDTHDLLVNLGVNGAATTARAAFTP